ncbi:MAG: type II secretion system F family protein [Actinomycetota bacterium]
MTAVRIARSILAVGVMLALVVAWGTGGAEAQEQAPPPRITAVDATDDTVEIAFSELGAGSASDVVLSVEGESVDVVALTSAEAEARATEIVVVVDTNRRGVDPVVLSALASQLDAIVEDAGPNVSVGVVEAGARGRVMVPLTNDRGRLATALDELVPTNGTKISAGIAAAADLFVGGSGSVRSVLVLTTGTDSEGEFSLARAQVGLVQTGAQVFAVHVGTEGSVLDELASLTSGRTWRAGEDDINQLLGAAVSASLDRDLVTFVPPPDLGNRVAVAVAVGDDGTPTELSYPSGALTTSSLQLAARPDLVGDGGGFFRSSIGLYLSIGLAFIGITLGVWSFGSIMIGRQHTLDAMLARYSESGGEAAADGIDEGLVQSALLQRAVSMSEQFAEQQGFLSRVEEFLERANLPMRAGEAIFFMGAGTALAASFGLVLTRSIIVAVGLGMVMAMTLVVIVRVLAWRRFRAFESQLPDMLQLLAGTLRAGYSLPQGMEAVAQEVAEPMGGELRRAITEARLGRDLEDCLGSVAERMNSADFAWAVMAIGIQREVGGNLNELLLSVADTMVARDRLKREVSALTAEGKMSAAVLLFLPPGLGFVMWIMNPGYIALLFTEPMGNILLGLGIISGLVGMTWMRKVITIDV